MSAVHATVTLTAFLRLANEVIALLDEEDIALTAAREYLKVCREGDHSAESATLAALA